MRPPLTRSRILDTALEIVDRDGLDALTMRRLGSALGVEAMSLYRHVDNKEAVLAGMIERIILGIDVPADPDCPWEDAFRQAARSYRQAAIAHPNAFVLVATRPLTTPAALQRVNDFLDVLRRAGFDPHSSLVAFRTLASYIRGFALEETTGRALRAPGQPGAGPDAELARIAELAPALANADPSTEFELGLELILLGLRAHRPRGGDSEAAAP